ncbi:MAG: 4-hydroxyphenylacetate 3-hydroxylase N-terminal domain-containing protein, partial [Sulfobacillus sp.]
MPACRGQEFRNRLDSVPRDVWIQGEQITTGISRHPAFANLVDTISQLYDLQHDPALVSTMTYTSPKTGQPVGMSFLQPRADEDLVRRREMMLTWARFSGGMLGRTPDYLNASLMAFAAAQSYFEDSRAGFGKNIQAYYEQVRESDLCLTHTLINPQANRAVSAAQQKDPYLAARIVKETDQGVVIKGARMLATLGPVSDEIMVFPSTVLKGQDEDQPYAFAFAIPSTTPGLKYLCRESFDYGKSHFDHPL